METATFLVALAVSVLAGTAIARRLDFPPPLFLVVANIAAEDGGRAIALGNERVLRARLADARFFWDQDRKVRLGDRVAALGKVVFHARLGTMEDKVGRLQALAAELAPRIPGADLGRVRSAALLAKADLSTGMVGEFPELQGVMGGYYPSNGITLGSALVFGHLAGLHVAKRP